MNIEELDKKYLFTETERQILLFLNQNFDKIDQLTVRDVAAGCFVSPATIIKLTKKMNLSGYSELISKIKNHTEITIPSHFIEQSGLAPAYEIIENNHEKFQQLLDQYKENKIMILSTGFSEHVANYIYEVLVLRDYRVLLRSHLKILDEQDTSKSLLIAISESGETTILKDIVLQASKNNIDIISLTGNTTSTIAESSTLDLSIDLYKGLSKYSDEEPHFFYGIALIIFEALINFS